MAPKTRIAGLLEIGRPIVQRGMQNVGVAELAAAVCRSGVPRPARRIHRRRRPEMMVPSSRPYFSLPHRAVRPPSMMCSVPVMNVDSSDARKTTRLLTSSTSPTRLMGTDALAILICSTSSAAVIIGVRM